MPIVTFRGEANVGEVADKVFTRLTPKQREKAEAELLKANPQLKSMNKMETGTILRVPDVPELRAKTNRKLENPDDQIAKAISESLANLGSSTEKSLAAEKDALKEQAGLIKSAKFKRLISADPTLQELAKDATKHIAERSKELDERKKKIANTLKLAAGDLKKEFL